MKKLTLLVFLMLANKSFAADTFNKTLMWCYDSAHETAANFMMDPVRPMMDKNKNLIWKKHYPNNYYSVTTQIKLTELNTQFSRIESSIKVFENKSNSVLAETTNTQTLETASLIAHSRQDKKTVTRALEENTIVSVVTSTPLFPLTASQIGWDQIAEKYNYLKVSCSLYAATDDLWNSRFTLDSDPEDLKP